MDIVFGDEWDLSSADVQEKVRKDIRLADACFWAPECSTFSRARNRRLAIPGGGPPILRSETFVKGFPTIRGSDAIKVERANRFTEFTFKEVKSAVQRGKSRTPGILGCGVFQRRWN